MVLVTVAASLITRLPFTASVAVSAVTSAAPSPSVSMPATYAPGTHTDTPSSFSITGFVTAVTTDSVQASASAL